MVCSDVCFNHMSFPTRFQLPKMLLRSCFWCGSTIKHKESSTQNRAATSLDDVIFHFAFKERNPNFFKHLRRCSVEISLRVPNW